MRFDVQRLWDVWPLKDARAIRALFRRSTEKVVGNTVHNVFVHPGHVFIIKPTREDQEVFVFDNSPKSASSQMPHYDVQEHHFDPLLVVHVPLISILSDNSNMRQVYLVLKNGYTEQWLYSVETRKWNKGRTYQLSAKGDLHSVVMVPNTQIVIWSECQPTEDEQVTFAVCQQSLSSDLDYRMKSSLRIVEGCTNVHLYATDSMVAIWARSAIQQNLIYFWNIKDQVLMPFLWGKTLPLLVRRLKPGCTHKSVVVKIASLLTKKSPCSVVAVTVDVCDQKITILLNNGQVHEVWLCKDASQWSLKERLLVELSDFHEHFPRFGHPAKEQRSQIVTEMTNLEMFCYQTYIGILYKGLIRLYDEHSGEMVWISDEHEGDRVNLWRFGGHAPSAGLWTDDALWIIRSHKITEQAEFLVKGQFPVTINADGTTPWDYLTSGPRHAAELCRKWNLQLWSSKYALDEIHEVVMETKDKSVSQDKEEDLTQSEAPFKLPVTEDLVSMSVKGLQNPGLLVAIMAEHPVYKDILKKETLEFLKKKDDGFILTSLNKKIVPYLEEFRRLHEEYETKLNHLAWKDASLPKIEDEVKGKLLSFYSQDRPPTDTIAMSLKCSIEKLTMTRPQETLRGIRNYLNIDKFEEACKNVPAHVGNHNWKAMLVAEVSPALVSVSLDLDRTPKLLFFELTCSLLYQEEPNELIPFILFVSEARSLQTRHKTAFPRSVKKDFFWLRALEALPTNLHGNSTTDNEWLESAVKIKCHIVLQSEIQNSKVLALKVLLENKFWRDAVELYKSLIEKEEDSGSSKECVYYSFLLSAILEGGQYVQFQEELDSLMPRGFSHQNFLRALTVLPSSETEECSGVVGSDLFSVTPPPGDQTTVRVGHVKKVLVKLLTDKVVRS